MEDPGCVAIPPLLTCLHKWLLLGLFLPMGGCLMCAEGCRTWGEPQHHKALVLFGGCSLWRFGTVPLSDSPRGFTARTSVSRHEAQGTHSHLAGGLQPRLNCSEEVNLQQFPSYITKCLAAVWPGSCLSLSHALDS